MQMQKKKKNKKEANCDDSDLFVIQFNIFTNIFFSILGLPNEVYLLWQQYPWIFGEGLCKIRALVSEM